MVRETEQSPDVLNQQEAIKIGSYTIIRGTLSMLDEGVSPENIFEQMVKAGAELEKEIPFPLAEIVRMMAEDTGKIAAKRYNKGA